jgi:hypothetical protein
VDETNMKYPFDKAVKIRLIEMGKTQTWLCGEITARTGLYVDSGYLDRIYKGKRNAPKIVAAIREILSLE